MTKEEKNLKVFGYGLAAILLFFAVKNWLKFQWNPLNILLIVLAGFFILITVLNLKTLKTIYRKWMAVAHVIGSVVTIFILSVLFYVVFGLVGILLRLMRKDLLDRAIDSQKQSYWKRRNPVEFNKEHYLRQF